MVDYRWREQFEIEENNMGYWPDDEYESFDAPLAANAKPNSEETQTEQVMAAIRSKNMDKMVKRSSLGQSRGSYSITANESGLQDFIFSEETKHLKTWSPLRGKGSRSDESKFRYFSLAEVEILPHRSREPSVSKAKPAEEPKLHSAKKSPEKDEPVVKQDSTPLKESTSRQSPNKAATSPEVEKSKEESLPESPVSERGTPVHERQQRMFERHQDTLRLGRISEVSLDYTVMQSGGEDINRLLRSSNAVSSQRMLASSRGDSLNKKASPEHLQAPFNQLDLLGREFDINIKNSRSEQLATRLPQHFGSQEVPFKSESIIKVSQTSQKEHKPVDFEELVRGIQELEQQAANKSQRLMPEHTLSSSKPTAELVANPIQASPSFFRKQTEAQIIEASTEKQIVAQSPIPDSNTERSVITVENVEEISQDESVNGVCAEVTWKTASGKVLKATDISISSDDDEDIRPVSKTTLNTCIPTKAQTTCNPSASKQLDIETPDPARQGSAIIENESETEQSSGAITISDASPDYSEASSCVLSASKLDQTANYFTSIKMMDSALKDLQKSDLDTLGSIQNILDRISESEKSNKQIICSLMTEKVRNLEKVLMRFCSAQEERRYQDSTAIHLLSLSQMQVVGDIWDNQDYPESKLVVEHPHILEKLTVRNLRTLKPPNWLNDEVINGYLRLVDGRLVGDGSKLRVLNTHFFKELVDSSTKLPKLQRILARKQIDLKTLANLVVPINTGGAHWSFIDADFSKGAITLYDSLPSAYLPNQDLAISRLNMLQQERCQQGGGPMIPFTKAVRAKKFGKQVDPLNPDLISNDCGVFMLRGIYCLALDNGRINFGQSEAEYLRYLICHELIRGALQC